jgi:hypothetical protein
MKRKTVEEFEESYISRNKDFALFEEESTDTDLTEDLNSESVNDINSDTNSENIYTNKKKKSNKHMNYFTTSEKENYLKCIHCKKDIKFIVGTTSTGNLWTHGKTCFNKSISKVETEPISDEKYQKLNYLYLKVIFIKK